MILRLLCGRASNPGASSRSGSRARRPNSNGAPPAPKRNSGAPRPGRGTNASSSGAAQRPAAQSTKAAHSKSPSISAPAALGSPQTVIEEATAAAATAQAAVERASGQRLATLLERPARERLEHLRDPALTAADRRRLRDSIGSALPRRTAAKGRRTSVAGLPALRRRWSTAAAIIVLVALVGLAFTAWRNTALRIVVSPQTRIVKWTLPDGREFVGAWRAGYPAVVTRQQEGEITLRYWLTGTGYAQTTVPAGWLGSHIRAGP